MLMAGLVACTNESQTTTNDEDTATTDMPAPETTTTAKTYVDLNTGQTIDVWYDPEKKYTVDRATGNRVDLYVDLATNDTMYGYGADAVVVNSAVVKDKEGKWKLDDMKVKWEGDKLKLKHPDGEKHKVKEKDDEPK
jgi:hypothetical protein